MFHSSLTPTRAGLAAILTVGTMLTISAFSAVRAERTVPDKSACSKSSYCKTYANTGSGGGFEATATSGTGIQGTTSAGNGDSAVSGVDSGTAGAGIFGSSSGGSGVFGASSFAGGAGVHGIMKGKSTNNGSGVLGESADSTGNYEALAALGDDSKTYLLRAVNQATGGYCVIDPIGNLSCSGGTDAKTLRTHHTTSAGRRVLAYAAESASATIEDVGTARMIGGVANVVLDPAFASTIDPNSPYQVFLTPLGDMRGLYVRIKTARGFEVREAQGGRSTLSFDYRIVARPIDASRDRLPLAPAGRNMRSALRSAL